MPAKAKSIRLDRHVESMFQKTKMCKFFARGACARGSQCIFAHGHAELAPLPDFACTKICPALSRSGVCGDIKCKFAHDHGQLRPRVADREVAQATGFEDTAVCQQEAVKATVAAGEAGTKGCWSRQTTAESSPGQGEQQAPEDDDFSDISDYDDDDDGAAEIVGLEESNNMEDDHLVTFQVCVTNTFISLVETANDGSGSELAQDAPEIAVRKVKSAPEFCVLMSQEEEELEAPVRPAEPAKKGEQLYSSESTVLAAPVIPAEAANYSSESTLSAAGDASDSDFSERCSIRATADAAFYEAVVKNTFLDFADKDEFDRTLQLAIRKVVSTPGVFSSK